MATSPHTSPVSTERAHTDPVAAGEVVAAAATPSERPDRSPSSSPATGARVQPSSSSPSTPAAASTPPSRPSLVSLGSSSQPKKFSSVNINKKFLEKTSSTSASAAAASGSALAKSGSPTTRPSTQSSASHSRLVTTKLTTSAVPPTAGWSRPPSVVPSPPTSISPTGTPHPVPAPLNQTTSGPHLPLVGKVVQPQPRSAVQPSLKDPSAAKPVWGSVKAPVTPLVEPSDFPTVAEVVNVGSGRKPTKSDDQRTEDPAAKQARMEDEDAFRGLHLGPNTKHWDEMEGDDDFLGGVIEFGDGRQYTVDTSQTASPPRAGAKSEAEAGPVSKEERFVDDFDRSWPKSRPSGSSIGERAQSRSPTATSSVQHLSPKDPSRVLFNERSNRLEPYSRTFSKRSANENGAVPEARSPQESHHSLHPEPGRRRFSGGNGGMAAPGGYERRDRDHGPPRRDGPPPSPRAFRGEEFPDRGHRMMGPPPLPREGRQLPPHLSPVAPMARRLPSQDSRRVPSESSSGQYLRSPALSSHVLSPLAPTSALPVNGADIEDVKKDLMHSAAERAKQRRMQEEAEREAQKERARRKATELEEKMKAAEAEKARAKEKEDAEANAKKEREEQASALIADAISTATTKSPSEAKTEPPIDRRRPPSLRGVPRDSDAAQMRKPSLPPIRSAAAVVAAPSPATQADSWRTKAGPLPPVASRQIESKSVAPGSVAATPTLITSTPSALERVETVADGTRDELEVVDFSDMGKFVGVPENGKAGDKSEEPKSSAIVAPGIAATRSRPTASDFFDESLSSEKQQDFNAWRRRVSHGDLVSQGRHSDVKPSTATEVAKAEGSTRADGDASRDTARTESTPDAEQSTILPPFLTAQRSPRATAFPKEASMSSLDNTISRIKGVIDGLHTGPPLEHDVPARSPKTRRSWQPPVSVDDHTDEYRELFLVSMPEPPSLPTSTTPTIKFPSSSRRIDAISQRQLRAFWQTAQHARMDILSFDPPVYDMNRGSLSVTDVLHRRPFVHKPGFKYRVYLPRARGGPKVHIPITNGVKRLGGTGAFGRTTQADERTSWRKPAAAVSPITEPEPASPGTLDTTSRSPPPEFLSPKITIASIPKSSETSPAKSDGKDGQPRPRHPKMPAGSAVAFYRDVEVKEERRLSVNFIVGDLDESKPTSLVVEKQKESAPAAAAVSGKQTAPSLSTASSASKDSVASSDPVKTPSSADHSSSWTKPDSDFSKGSPLRKPDPEKLKALWSQGSTKSGINATNSLEGIADDLSSIPFSLQDVKSEDGATPPPLPSAPSRMSLHEVTKAFQQVPVSSSTSTSSSTTTQSRPAVSPPSTNGAAPRPQYSYAMAPPPQGGMRPAYPYASPMMTPSPVMYPHPMQSSPVPSRMQPNGAQPMPMYPQPMWVPVPAPGPQPHGAMMRPPMSPYPAQMMPYPVQGYPQPAMPGTPQPSNAATVGRGRAGPGGLPMVSPIMNHAVAHPHPGGMYAGSPVMMHPQAMGHGYGMAPPPQAGRGGQQQSGPGGAQQQRQDGNGMTNGQGPQYGGPSAVQQPYGSAAASYGGRW